MRKVLIGFLILAGFALGTIYTGSYFEQKMAGFIDGVEESSEKISEGNLNEAVMCLESSIEEWLELERYTYVFIHHTKIDAVSDAYYDYLSAIRTSGEDDEAQRDKLIYHLRDVAAQEKISLGSVF